MSGRDIADLTDEEIMASLDATAFPAGLAAREGISASELMRQTFAPIKWIVEGYVVEGLTILAGAPKMGKSWLMLGVSIAVGAGGKALGAVDCESGDVLYLALEDNNRRLQARLKQMRLTAWPDRVTFVTKWPTLDNGCIHEIETWVRSVSAPRLVVVDVFARVRGNTGSREAAYDADYRFAAMLQGVAGKHGLAVVAVHHTRKAGADDDPFDAVSGTRGLTGAADSVLVLKRPGHAQSPVLYGRGRDMEEIESALEFERETGNWYVIGDAAEIAKTSERQEILQVLGRSADPMSPTEIAAVLGKSRSNIAHLLAKLAHEGKVWKAERGRYTSITPFTSVTPAEST